jgi:ATP-dependent Lhr-like helicase
VRPVRRARHILGHQVLALTLQEAGVSRHRVLAMVGAAAPFQGFDQADVNRLVDTMIAREILHEADGLLSLGVKGERVYGRRNFFELYAVFHAPPMLKVMHGKADVGTVDAQFVQSHDPERGPLSFRLAGRPWRVVRTDLDRGVLQAEPAEAGRVPSWLGQGGFLSFALVQEMKRALREAGPEEGWLSPLAARELAGLREEYAGLVDEGPPALEDRDGKLYWHTFAGGAVNRVLAAGLKAAGTDAWVVSNVRWDGGSMAVARDAIRRLQTLDLDAIAAAEGCAHVALDPGDGAWPRRAA